MPEKPIMIKIDRIQKISNAIYKAIHDTMPDANNLEVYLAMMDNIAVANFKEGTKVIIIPCTNSEPSYTA